jgi:hypothetical protein
MAAVLSIQQNCSRFGFTIGSPAANGRGTGKNGQMRRDNEGFPPKF